MKTRNIHNRIAGLLLGLSLLFVIGIGFSTNVYAQDRDWARYGNYGGTDQLRQTALNAGYNEGIRAANDDRQHRRQSNYQSSSAYRKATQGYNSRLGDRELYRRYFREGFESGYNFNGNNQGTRVGDDRYRYPDRNNTVIQARRGRNWDGYGNFGGSAELRQTALNAGYNEGNKQGHNDRNRRNNSGFQGQSAYQRATKDYNSRLGDRSLYQRYFREAYENGYSDAVNGY